MSELMHDVEFEFDIVEVETIEAPGAKTKAICGAIVAIVCALLCC